MTINIHSTSPILNNLLHKCQKISLTHHVTVCAWMCLRVHVCTLPILPRYPLFRQAGSMSNQNSGDVLSEIDNMLQGLTDELDAMLEFDLDE